MVTQDEIVAPVVVAGWSEAFGELHDRMGRRFSRSEASNRVKHYLAGLLRRVERMNGWQMAEAIGEHDPQGVQRLLNSAKWDAYEVRDDLRKYVVEHLGDAETGVLSSWTRAVSSRRVRRASALRASTRLLAGEARGVR
jgi:hypothetical protein